MSGFLSLIVAAVGLVMFFITNKPESNKEIKEVGRIMFWTGLLAFLLANGSAVIGVLGR